MEVYGSDIAAYTGQLNRAREALRMWEAHPHPDRGSLDYIEETKNLKSDVAHYERMVQAAYVAAGDPQRLRGLVDSSQFYLERMGPVDAAAVRARNARLLAEADRLEGAKAASQAKLERINFGPSEAGPDRRIPQDVIGYIHAFGQGAPGRAAAAATIHAAQGARARAAVLQ